MTNRSTLLGVPLFEFKTPLPRRNEKTPSDFAPKRPARTTRWSRRFFLLGIFLIWGLWGIQPPTSIGQETSPAITASETNLPPVRVLIITGVDYPGHLWRETAPVLQKILNADRRIEARVCEDVEILGTDVVFDYDVLLIHFKNYDRLHREIAAQENLVEFLQRGGGLVYFHFSCGAFENWDGFEQVAGRVWNPTFRGHDPIQEFEVKITAPEHPVMQGLRNFKLTDELYTCLDGTREIHVIAEATSTVDQKNYPIAFVFEQGEGRVFHTVLGHDRRAVETPALAPLMINATLWVAKRLPVEK